MLTQPLLDKLIQLRLPAFRTGLQEQLNNPKYAELSFEERLTILVDMECTRRHDRRLQRLIKLAAFPQSATLEDLDLSASRGLERRFVLELAQCNWIDQHRNTLVLGPTGSGKSFLSCALGLAACRTGHSVHYSRTSRLLFQLTQSHLDGSFPDLLASLAKLDLLILDDWMRDPIPLTGTQDLLEIFDDRFNKKSTLIVSQVPVTDWHPRFPDPTLADAILDRTIHNAYRISLLGASQRKLRADRIMPHT